MTPPQQTPRSASGPAPGATPLRPVGPGPASPVAEARRLADLLTRQRDLYRELAAYSERQQQLIDAGQTEELLAVLTQRQTLVDQLQACNREVAPLRGRMADLAAAGGPEVRATIRARVDEVQQLLEGIIGRDEADRERLETARNRVGQELQRVNRAPAAANAYAAAAAAGRGGPGRTANAARFTDGRA